MLYTCHPINNNNDDDNNNNNKIIKPFRNARSTSNINMSSSDSDDDNNNKLFQNNFSSNSNIKNRSVSPGNFFYHFEFLQLKKIILCDSIYQWRVF